MFVCMYVKSHMFWQKVLCLLFAARLSQSLEHPCLSSSTVRWEQTASGSLRRSKGYKVTAIKGFITPMCLIPPACEIHNNIIWDAFLEALIAHTLCQPAVVLLNSSVPLTLGIFWLALPLKSCSCVQPLQYLARLKHSILATKLEAPLSTGHDYTTCYKPAALPLAAARGPLVPSLLLAARHPVL